MHKALKKSILVLERINDEIGIDMTKYQNNEIIEKIISLLIIQKYAVSSLIKPTIISFFLFITGFFILNIEIIGIIIYTLFGSILFFFMGISYGILRLLSKLKNDLHVITDFALETTTNILKDLNHVNHQLKNDVQNPYGLIFEGTIAVIVSPAICKVLGKVPLVGNILITGSHKVLGIVVTNFKNQETKMNFPSALLDTRNVIAETVDLVENFITSFSTTVDKTINKAFIYLHSPVKYCLIGITFFTICLMLSLHIF